MEGNKWVHGHAEESARCSLLGFISGIPGTESLPTQPFPQSCFHLNGAPLPRGEMKGSSSLSAIYSASSVMMGEHTVALIYNVGFFSKREVIPEHYFLHCLVYVWMASRCRKMKTSKTRSSTAKICQCFQGLGRQAEQPAGLGRKVSASRSEERWSFLRGLNWPLGTWKLLLLLP